MVAEVDSIFTVDDEKYYINHQITVQLQLYEPLGTAPDSDMRKYG